MDTLLMAPHIRLEFWRKSKQLTQAQLAKKVGVSQVLISKIERGELLSINLELLGKLARALGVEARDLVADDGEAR